MVIGLSQMSHTGIMNILFVNNFRGRGGGEEFLRDLLPGLVQKGVKVGLVCRPGTPLVDMFQQSEVNIYPINRSGTNALTSVFKIARIIMDEGYEIINIQRGHDIIQSWTASVLSRKNPILIYTPQVPEFLKSRFILGRLDRIVTISRHIKDKLTSFHLPIAQKTSIIHYGIDLSRFTPDNARQGMLRRKFNLSDDVPLIGTVGDLWKNQIEFLDALIDIRREYPDARFVLAASEFGIGEVVVFKNRVAELGLDDAVLWTGRLSKDEMLFFYSDIDIAVSTHRNEGFGIWVLEALAMGKPVVAFNAGGIRDSLENCPAGVLVDGGAREMAGEIIRILRHHPVRQQMAAAGPSWVSARFRRERMVEEYLRFFETVRNEKK